MDFKSLMASQIAKSKTPTSTPASNTSKYQRRSEIEATRQAAYAAEQEKLEREREERAAKKRKLEDEEAEKNAVREAKLRKLAEESKTRREAEEKEEERRRRKRLGLPELVEGSLDTNGLTQPTPEPQDQPDIDDAQLQSKLRELSEPAKLFDEDHGARLARYHKLTSHQTQTQLSTKSKHTTGPIPTTLEPVPEQDMRLPDTVPTAGTADHEFLHRQIASYFTLLLTEWSHSLATRDESVKSSQTGQAALQTYRNVLTELTPLFRKLETRSLPPDLFDPLVEITRNVQRRRYLDANDGYLRLSIGKAAWPIGVTMVGIHERSARERIHDGAGGGQKKAHIMSDEVTRKWLQSVKRCVSFAQTRWPPDDGAQLMG